MTKSIDVVPTWYWPDGVPRTLSPPRSTVYKAAVERWSRRSPQSVALQQGETTVDFAELDQRIRLAAGRLLGAADRSGDEEAELRVAVSAPVGVEGVVVLLGAMRAGAHTLVLDAGAPGDHGRVLEQFGAEVVVAAAGAVDGPWSTTSLSHVAGPGDAGEAPDDLPDRSARATLGFRWGEALVLHPNEPLLGWALAFRAFTSLGRGDRFAVPRSSVGWEAIIGLLAPLVVGDTAVLATGSLDDAVAAARTGELAGVWIDWEDAVALMDADGAGSPPRDARSWVYVTVREPVPVRTRRRLSRVLGRPVLTAFGTPATGLVAASPQVWFIEEAVGIPLTGVDLVPVDGVGGHLAEPPWPLLAYANVGVKSSFLAPPSSLSGDAPGGFVEPDVLDTGVIGRIDANGFLYLLA